MIHKSMSCYELKTGKICSARLYSPILTYKPRLCRHRILSKGERQFACEKNQRETLVQSQENWLNTFKCHSLVDISWHLMAIII